jgi:plastocyanin
MEDNSFVQTALTIASGADVVIQVNNNGAALHNLHIATTGAFEDGDTAICKKGAPGCSDPANIRGGQSGTNTVNLAPGTYAYRCDFHIAEMQGTLTVQ